MSGSGSAFIAYMHQKGNVIWLKNSLINNIKNIGASVQKLYKFYFLCYTKIIGA